MHIFKKCYFVIIGLLLVILVAPGCSKPAMIELNVSAALSLVDVLQEINDLYTQENPDVIISPNFASSGTLQKQIEQGAPADVFFSAGAKQMDDLQDGGLIINDTRRNLLSNKVVLIVPSNSNLGICSFMDLLNENVEKIAFGDPEFVPIGTYGTQTLEMFGIYEQVQQKLVLCSDVRQVLAYVEGGNVDAGVVFSTDAATSNCVTVVAESSAEINSNVVYPIAVIKTSTNVQAAKDYIAFLLSDEAKAIFEQYGFVVVNQ
jgi:molybdate transport system substrate-binding protein